MKEDAGTKKYVLKKDRFRKTRGGRSNFLNLSCVACGAWLLLYQKDGPGKLWRSYLDRIHAPESLSSLHEQFTPANVDAVPPLKCSSCDAIIAHAIVFQPEGENRLAYNLVQGSFRKSRSTGTVLATPAQEESE